MVIGTDALHDLEKNTGGDIFRCFRILKKPETLPMDLFGVPAPELLEAPHISSLPKALHKLLIGQV
jgi:hypothetical protein